METVKRNKLYYITLLIICAACNFAVRPRMGDINSNYRIDILKYKDSKRLAHFPKSLQYNPSGYLTKEGSQNVGEGRFAFTTVPNNILDTIKSFCSTRGLISYNSSMKNLLIEGRFIDELNFLERKPVPNRILKPYLSKFNEDDDHYPIPNFNVLSICENNTECGLDNGYHIIVLEAEKGKFRPDEELTNGSMMPAHWIHGFSRGIAFSEESRMVIYWYIVW